MADEDTAPDQREITKLLHLASEGDDSAKEELMRSVETELRRIASIHMRRERPDHTLQPTAVMNEAVMRLLGSENWRFNDRQHFLSVASRVMRHVLVDHARRMRVPVAPLDIAQASVGPVSADVLDVHAALEKLAEFAPRQAKLVELRFFGGLTLEEAALELGISARAADQDWALARAWLKRELGKKS
jgi:RNA polymerase sigma-70 factor (ECF subfamily)